MLFFAKLRALKTENLRAVLEVFRIAVAISLNVLVLLITRRPTNSGVFSVTQIYYQNALKRKLDMFFFGNCIFF